MADLLGRGRTRRGCPIVICPARYRPATDVCAAGLISRAHRWSRRLLPAYHLSITCLQYLVCLPQALLHRLPFSVTTTACVFIIVVIKAQGINKLPRKRFLSLTQGIVVQCRSSFAPWQLLNARYTAVQGWRQGWLLWPRDGQWSCNACLAPHPATGNQLRSLRPAARQVMPSSSSPCRHLRPGETEALSIPRREPAAPQRQETS